MKIGTTNYVVTRQIQNSNIPFRYQVNLPLNTHSHMPTKSIPKENQLKILNEIYQTHLVSTTGIKLDKKISEPAVIAKKKWPDQLSMIKLHR